MKESWLVEEKLIKPQRPKQTCSGFDLIKLISNFKVARIKNASETGAHDNCILFL